MWWQELGWLQAAGRMGRVRMGWRAQPRESVSERGQVCCASREAGVRGEREAGVQKSWPVMQRRALPK